MISEPSRVKIYIHVDKYESRVFRKEVFITPSIVFNIFRFYSAFVKPNTVNNKRV